MQHQRSVVAGAEVASREFLFTKIAHHALRQFDRDRIIRIGAGEIAGEAPGVLEVSTAGEKAERIVRHRGIARQRRLSELADDRRLLDDRGQWLTPYVTADQRLLTA